MRNYDVNLLVRLSIVIVLAITVGVLLMLYFSISFISFIPFIFFISLTLLLLAYSTYALFRFVRRSQRDVQRLMNAIRFSETNISFQNSEKKGLPLELSMQMEDSIALFNKKLLQIETEQQFYNNLLNRIDSGILVTNKNGDIEWINKAALDEFGKPQPRKISDLKSISPDLPVVLENIVPQETKIIRIQKESRLQHLAITAVLFISKGKEQKLISIKNIESVVEESESDAWKKLVRVLTHEIMNSITPIISLSESFSEQDADEETLKLMDKAMKTIHRRSKGLVDFVQSYQKLTRIPDPVIEPVPVKDIMDDIADLLAAEGIKFSYSITPEELFWKVDRSQIEQVLINLIKNAWEACQEIQQPEIQINITKNEYQRPVISISDNGSGILPDVLDKIFVPFFTTKQGGSGIGLSICRQIINSHGGTISVSSQPEKGSCFTIRI